MTTTAEKKKKEKEKEKEKENDATARARKRELSQRATTEQIEKEMFRRAGNDDDKAIDATFVNDAAEYFHKHQNFANKWDPSQSPKPILVFSAQCSDLQQYAVSCQKAW